MYEYKIGLRLTQKHTETPATKLDKLLRLVLQNELLCTFEILPIETKYKPRILNRHKKASKLRHTKKRFIWLLALKLRKLHLRQQTSARI